jgi:hypothetical protein
MTFKFIQEYTDSRDNLVQRVTFELPQDSTLIQVIEGFEHFLKGAGYQLDGYLDIVPHEEDVQPERHEWYEDKAADQEFPPEMFESQDVMAMPGTMGGATVMFTEPNDRCKRCGLTRAQLGLHTCYDESCGLK